MELKDTTVMMTSPDYKERFKAEYYQLKIRYEKLKKMFDNWDNLDFKPTCPKSLYRRQLQAMNNYLLILNTRAELENIDLEGDKNINE